MNERIQELAVQAGLISAEYNGFDSMNLTKTQIKFAELIVRKCIGLVENEASQYAEPVWAVELVDDMREYFGVLE